MKVSQGSAYFTSRTWIIIAAVLSLIFHLATIPEAATTYTRSRCITEQLSHPSAVAVDINDNLYVAESGSNKLLVFSRSGEYLKKLEGLDRPVSVAVDEGRRIYIGNTGRGNVEVYDWSFKLLFKLGAGDGEFTLPSSIAIDGAGNIYVSDSKEDKVKIYAREGSYKGTLGAEGAFRFPTALAISRSTGELIITDLPVIQSKTGPTVGARVQVYDMTGMLKRSFGDYGQGEGKLTTPMGVAVDSVGRIYVTDSFQNVVQIFDTSGTTLGAMYDPDNPLRTPLGITINSRDISFIASLNTGRVEVFALSALTIRK